jgi:hypothetical protein
MLEKIKNIWNELKFALVALGLFVTYFIGRKKGKQDEKASQNEKVLENLGRANKARTGLRNPSVVDKLHDKYKR